MREKICFDKNWRFHKGDINYPTPNFKGVMYAQAKTKRKEYGPAAVTYDSAPDSYDKEKGINPDRWDVVDLPHDFIISGTPDEKNNNAMGYLEYDNAWYVKRFKLDEGDKGKRLKLYFEGVAVHATVYVNGCLMLHNFCGYTSFEVDFTNIAKFGDTENVVSVYVSTEEKEGWWYEGGGIYRHVWLVKTNPVAVDLYGVYAKNEKKDENNWLTTVETTVRNDNFEEFSGSVKTEIVDKDGKVVATAQSDITIERKFKATVSQPISIQNPDLWDIDAPNLYNVHTTVCDNNGNILDEYDTSFGYRTLEFSSKGFFLNGKKTIIKGVCCHQDYGITGKAVPDNIHRYRMRLMKEMGANALRTSHYPNAEATMDACDKYGIMVMDETRWFESTPEGLSQLEMLMKRDRNRPSVIMWSIGNEEPFFASEEGKNIAEDLYAFAKRFDTTRPVMAAISNTPAQATINGLNDIIGVNYNLDDYDILHEKFPDKAIFASECCATGTSRGWYLPNDAKRGRIRAYDGDTDSWFRGRELTWKFLMERPYICGAFQWAGTEHRGETVWPRLCSVSGAYDLFLIRKDAFYQNRSHWTDTPMVHILPHWNLDGFEGQEVTVQVYNNCEEVELIVNGVSCGRQQMEKYSRGDWQVEYAPGEITAIGFIGGKEVTRETLYTTGKPVALKLELQNGEDIAANGEDLAVIHCTCVDEQGRHVPDAAPFVSFTTNGLGSVAGTGSDNTDHIVPSCPDRKMYAGVVAAAIKLGDQKGTLRVYAKADGLKTARIDIELK